MTEKIITVADGYVIPRGWHFASMLSQGENQFGIHTLTILIQQDASCITDPDEPAETNNRDGGDTSFDFSRVSARGGKAYSEQSEVHHEGEYAGEVVTTEHTGRMLSDEDPFEATLIEMLAVRDKKKNDYSADNNPWSNFDATAEHFGLQNYDSAIFNVVQKLSRLKELRSPHKLVANEPVYDTYLDTAVFAVLAFAMYREQELQRKKAEEKYLLGHQPTTPGEYAPRYPIGHVPAGRDRFA